MKILLLLFLFCFSTSAFAQEYGDSLSHHQAGIAASSISGIGATYSYIFNPTFRIKTTLFAYYESQQDNSYDWTGSLGLEFQYTLESSSITRFYGLVGGYYYVYRNNYSSYIVVNPPGNNQAINDVQTEKHFAIGLGIGFEVLVWHHVAFNLDGGFQYYVKRTDYTGDNTSPFYSTKYFGPGGGIGINYRF